MAYLRVVLDTNVVVSALRSRRGASHRVLRLIAFDALEISVSVPLFLEYQAAASRLPDGPALSREDVEAVLRYIAANASRQQVFFLWRPVSRDPDDDMVLELAVAAQAEAIVTFNKRDFRGAEQFGIRLLTPSELLAELGEL